MVLVWKIMDDSPNSPNFPAIQYVHAYHRTAYEWKALSIIILSFTETFILENLSDKG